LRRQAGTRVGQRFGGCYALFALSRKAADSIAWPPNWRPFESDSRVAEAKAGELQRELALGHPLFGSEVEPVAECQACDSVLFRVLPRKWALVHLTWSQHPEAPGFPLTSIVTTNDALNELLQKHTD
jgi:hypothetical protein